MIFATVGSQIGFDRLVLALDLWAKENKDIKIICQIGDGEYQPKHMKFIRNLSPTEFNEHVAQCDLMLAHAGIGSILAAIDAKKRIVIYPRRGDLRETRNDHQIATSKWMENKEGIDVVWSDAELYTTLQSRTMSISSEYLSASSPDELINNIRSYIKLNA